MKFRWRRAATAMTAIAMVAGSLFLVGPASAQPVESGSLSLTSDPDDPIGQGQSFSYNTTAGDTMTVTGDGSDEHSIDAEVDGTDGNHWYLSLYGVAGKALAPGTYTVTTVYGTPAINVWRPGYTCWGLGSFTIDKITWGRAKGYVKALDASFEYHCWGNAPAIRGQVHIVNPPAPPPIKVGVNVAAHGTAGAPDGSATVHGTVRCSQSTELGVDGTLSQTRDGQRVEAEYHAPGINCTAGTRVAWSATATPPDGMTFREGRARTKVEAVGYDLLYDTPISVHRVTAVTLTK
jgi:hypothetical protein